MPRTETPATIAMRDSLAQLMAQGCPTVAEAGRCLGISQTEADRHWQRIKRDLGPQAR